jgi:hypothetical protein
MPVIPLRTSLKQAITVGYRPKSDTSLREPSSKLGAAKVANIPEACHVGRGVSVSEKKLFEFRHYPLDHDGQKTGATCQEQCYTCFFPHDVPPNLVCDFQPVPPQVPAQAREA